MVPEKSILPDSPEPLLPATLMDTPLSASPWNTAIPADNHKQHESDLSFPNEHVHYRRPHSI
jgi:hypothetical protein